MTKPNDDLFAVYASLKESHLFRYDLLPTIEACAVALVGEREHGVQHGEYLDSLVRHVVDYIGPRPDRGHWLATEYDPQLMEDIGSTHFGTGIQFNRAGVSWVAEHDLVGSLCPVECVVAVRHHGRADNVLAIVPRR